MKSFLLLINFIIHFILFNLNLCRKQSKLEYNKNRTFTILQFTDLHFGESYFGDLVTMSTQEFLINKTNPDLVVVTGDSVSGYSWHGVADWSFNLWEKWTSVFKNTQTKYAYTFGNHDDGADLNRQQIYNLELTHPYSLTQKSENIHGLTNYYLPIFSSYNNSEIATFLWLFDTNDNTCNYPHLYDETQEWGCVESDQINWYKNKSEELKSIYGLKKGMGFMHIPIPI